MAFEESKETFGQMLRWQEQPKDAEQAEKTIFIGEAVQGFYVEKREDVGQNDSTVYELLLPTGQKVSFWGSGLLDGKFKDIPQNCEVRVTYLGIAQPKTPKGRAYQNFKVEVDRTSMKPAELIEVDAPAQAAAPAPAPVAQPVAAPVAAAPVAAPTAPAAPIAAPTAPAPVAQPVAAPVAQPAAPAAPVAQPAAPAAPAPAAGDGF